MGSRSDAGETVGTPRSRLELSAALLGRAAGAWARLRRRPRLHQAVVAALLATPVLVFVRGLFPHPSYLGWFGDIRAFHFWWTVSRHTLLEYGELPLWNPYYCGGMVHWANVQTMMLTPTFWLSLVIGPGAGIRLHIVVHFVAGFWGCWALAGQRGLRGAWRLAPGIVFVFGANLAERATGHLGFMPFLLLPWLAYAYERARAEPRFAVVCGLLVAWCVVAGGPYPFVFFCAYLGLQAAYDVGTGALRRDPARAKRAAGIAALAVGLGAAVAAVKLWPVVDFMSEYPRRWDEPDFLLPWQVWEVFLEAPLVRDRKGYFYVFGEYRNYLGPVAMLAVPAMLLRWRARARDYWILAVAVALMVGNWGPWSPHQLLSRLPVFGSLRVPVRWALVADLHIALLFGHLLSAASAWWSGWCAARSREGGVTPGATPGGTPLSGARWARGAGIAVLGAALAWCAVDLMGNNARQLHGFYRDPGRVTPREGAFRSVPGDPHRVHEAPLRNEGHLRCYEPNPLKISPALRAGLPQEVYVAGAAPDDDAVQIAGWTPNSWTLDLSPSAAGRPVVVNMNYHRDWQATVGTVSSWRGLLSVEVPPGTERVELRYRPRRLGWYALLSLVGVGGAWVLWRRLG